MMLAELPEQPTQVWRQAFNAIKSGEFPYGTILKHGWFYYSFGITMPEADTPNGVAEKARLEYAATMADLKKALLHEAQLYLESRPGVGFELVHPQMQTGSAMKKGNSEFKRVLRNNARAVGNVRLHELSAEQRRENMDARAKLSMIARMSRKVIGPSF